MMKRTIVLRGVGVLALAAPLVLAACGGGGDDGGGGGGGDAEVEVVDVLFRPDEVTIDVGGKVVWTWSGRLPHEVVGTFNGAEVKSPRLTGSGTFEYTFATAGEFEYSCGVHGTGMAGKVIIQ